jgi:hypothetical protein
MKTEEWMYRSIFSLPLYPQRKIPSTHCVGSWVGPRAGVEDVEERKFLTVLGLKLWPFVMQPVASSCSDCAILAL